MPDAKRDWSTEALSKISRLADNLIEQPELTLAQVEFLRHAAWIAVTHSEQPSATVAWIKKLATMFESSTNEEPVRDPMQERQRSENRTEVLKLKVLLTARINSAIEAQARVKELKNVPTAARLALLTACEMNSKHLGLECRRAISVMSIGALEHAVLDVPTPSPKVQADIERMLWTSYSAIGDVANAKAAQRRLERLKP